MAAVTVKRKNRGRIRGKRSSAKVSTTKLSNKRLNKLAKQGKLKKRVGGSRQLQKLAGERHIEAGAVERPVSDIPLEEADYDYFATEQRDFRFLTNAKLQPKSFPKDKQKSQKKIDKNGVAAYEEVPRGGGLGETVTKHLLPIKSQERGLQLRSIELQAEDNATDEEGEDEDHALPDGAESEEPAQEELPPLTEAEFSQRRKEKLVERRQTIAFLASAVIENPEENVKKLRELVAMMSERDVVVAMTVRQLAAASLLEVFRDVVPGYHIRVTTDAERQQLAKKDIVTLWGYEDALLSHYKLYLEALEAMTRHDQGLASLGKRKRKLATENQLDAEDNKQLRLLAVRCLCELLVAHPHFNYRTNLIAVIVPFMDRGGSELTTMTCRYISRVFKEDKSGEVTLEVVRLIGRLIKSRKFNVKPQVLNTLLSLRIKEVERKGEKKPDSKKMMKKEKYMKTSRRDRKRNKDKVDLERELENAAASQDTRRTLRVNSEVIQLVFLTYFRILKQARHSVLLPAVLEGLAKFAHLINIDFFDDLFAVLNELVEGDELSYRESLHCVQTAFTILSGQGEALNIDPRRFYQHLYANLFHLHAGVSSGDVPVALQCLDIMIRKRRKQVSMQRLLAFVKRLATLSLQMTSEGCIGTLAAVRTFMHADSKTDILLDTECAGGGTYLPELEAVEHCNAHATALYELHTLRRHYHPTVRCYSSHLLVGAPSQGPAQLEHSIGRQSPSDLYEDFDSSTMKFNPAVDSKPAKKTKVFRPPRVMDAGLRAQTTACLQADGVDLSTCDFSQTTRVSNGATSVSTN